MRRPSIGKFSFHEGEALGARMICAAYPKSDVIIASGSNSQSTDADNHAHRRLQRIARHRRVRRSAGSIKANHMRTPLLFAVLLPLLAGCYTPYQVASTHTNQCVQVPWDGPPILAGTRVTLAQCFGRTDNQEWTVKNGRIAGVAGLCLDVQGQTGIDGAPVIAMPCNGSPGQHWSVTHGGVIGVGGKCLYDPGGEITESAPLILATCAGTSSQLGSLR